MNNNNETPSFLENGVIDFENYRSETRESTFNQLPAGDHVVEIIGVKRTNDRVSGFINPVPKPEDKLPEWSDETPQLAVQFKSEKGSTLHRFNGGGYERFDELENTDGFISSGDEGYAVDSKTMRRLVSESKTGSCRNIIAQLFNSAGLPEGSHYLKLIGQKLIITVNKETYNNRDQFKVSRTRAIAAVEAPA